MVYSSSERLMIKYGPTSTELLSHDDAWLYCATLTHENKYDWRMPNRLEHTSIPPSTWFDGRFSHLDQISRNTDIRRMKLGITPVRDL